MIPPPCCGLTLTTMRCRSVVARIHLPSNVTSTAVMASPIPGIEVLARISDLLEYNRI